MSKRLRLFPRATIGVYLIAIALAIALPILAFVALLLVQLEDSQRDALRLDTVQDAVTLARSIDRQLQDMSTTLRLLATSPELDKPDLATFHERTQTALGTDSMFVILVDSNGRQLLNTRRPYGEPLKMMSNIPALKHALDSRRTEVSDVFLGSTSETYVFNVTMPLATSPSGAALIMTQNAEELTRLLTVEGVAPGWSAAVLDGTGHVVASIGADHLAPGTLFKKDIMPALEGHSGIYQNEYTMPRDLLGYAQVPGWAWKTVVWGPIASVQGSIANIWRFLVYGGILLLLVALIAVYALARQVRTTIQDIADMAARMGRGEIVAPIDTSVIEANQVAVALSNASFDRSETEDRLHLVMHELVHRTKNLLALAQAMMRQLAKQTDSVDTFQKAVADRLDGLARSIDILTSEEWSGVSLRRVINLHLANFLQEPHQLEIEGQDILLRPEAVQNLGLALHELATNSVKYGALSVPEGRIHISWADVKDSGTPMIRFCWQETNGPAVKTPLHTGFGTTIIKTHAAAAFGGMVQVDFLPEGLLWVLTAQRSAVEREAGTHS
jgi:two-component sensor histidine kinase